MARSRALLRASGAPQPRRALPQWHRVPGMSSSCAGQGEEGGFSATLTMSAGLHPFLSPPGSSQPAPRTPRRGENWHRCPPKFSRPPLGSLRRFPGCQVSVNAASAAGKYAPAVRLRLAHGLAAARHGAAAAACSHHFRCHAMERPPRCHGAAVVPRIWAACTRLRLHGARRRAKTGGEQQGVAPTRKRWRSVYEEFILEVVAPHVANRFCGACDSLAYQAMPALRVCTPSDRTYGQRHRDGEYGHQPGQINWWLPLAPAYGSNTLWLQSGAATAAPLEGAFGDLHRFHGHAQHHFTKPNDTPSTRVSLDFCVVPGPCFDDDWPGSRSPETGKQAFFVGGYYAMAERVDGGQGWRVRRGEGGKGAPLRGNAAKKRRRPAAAMRA